MNCNYQEISMKLLPNQYRNGQCFFCGPANPVGLKLSFYETDTQPKELVCKWSPSRVFTGFGKILHGGIQSGLFDEIMGWTTLHLTERVGVTSSLNVEFLSPLYVEQEIEIRCRIDSQEGSRVNLTAEISNSDGRLCSRATGTYILMDPEKFRHITGEE